MQLLVLDKDLNTDLRLLLLLEYHREESLSFFGELASIFKMELETFVNLFANSIVDMLNLVVYDSIIEKVNTRLTTIIYHSLVNKTFPDNIIVRSSRLREAFRHNYDLLEYDTGDVNLKFTIMNYLNDIYYRNLQEMTSCVAEVTTYMDTRLSWKAGNIKDCVLITNSRPAVVTD